MKGKRSRMIGEAGKRRATVLAMGMVAVVLGGAVLAEEAPPPPVGVPAPPPVPDGVNLGEALSKALGSLMSGAPPGEQNPGEQAAPTTQAADAAQSADIRVSPDGRVEMHVRALELATVLEMLSMQSRRNIVASQSVTGTVSANLYDVTFDEAMTAILASNGCGWRESGNFIHVYTTQELSQMEATKRSATARLFHLHYVRAADAQVMIQPLLSEAGKLSVTPAAEKGIASNAEEGGGDNLSLEDCILVIDYPERLDGVEKLLGEIDVRPQQVLIEATILRARLNEENALGIDFNVLSGIDFEGVSATSQGGTNLGVGDLPAGQLNNTTLATGTDFAGSVPDGGLTFGFIKNNIAVFIRALEQVTDTNVIANPKVLTLNKQRGEVIVGQRDGYLTTTVTETAAIQNVEFLETGTQLIFRPFIGDNGYVRMEIHPKDSTGGLTGANLPSEQTTEVTTNVVVRDGHTIVIGGLFREVTRAGRGQLPLLGNIPVAGMLFRRTRDETQREEVIILLTVHLVKDDDAMDEASIEVAQDIERYRVGMRQGLQWFGRERLAQAHYQWAVEHAARGNASRALWDVDLAINNDPSLLAAMKLKEELLAKRAWDDEGSTVRGFLARQLMKEQGSIRPEFGRPAPPFDFPALRGPSGFDEGGDAAPARGAQDSGKGGS